MTSLRPPSLPLPSVVQSFFWIRRPTQFMAFWSRHFGSAYRLHLLPFEITLFSDPAAIRTIFAAKSDEMHAGEINRILRALVGDSSLLLLDGTEHMRHRKLLLPSFHGERMRLYGETMAEITRRIIAEWQPGEVFALHPHTQEITLQVMLRTVFGADEGAELDALHAQITKLLAAAEYRIAFVLMILLSTRPHLESHPLFRWLLRQRDRTDALLYEKIAARRRDPRAHERTDVLAMLMQARDETGEPMSDRELRDELITALVAGHETTATALAWTFECLLSNPEAYARLCEEIRGSEGAGARPEKLAALPFLDATVKEVLRLRPIVPVVGRRLQEPACIGGYDFPTGAAVGACIYLAHRNPDVYPEPERFKPERFLGAAPDPVSWLPFGGGIRRCIGAQFATYELKIVLGTLLAHCDFELAQALPIRTLRRAVTLFPDQGTRVRLLRSDLPRPQPNPEITEKRVNGHGLHLRGQAKANGRRGARVS
ncbi:MAG: cytochrome P450 [Polyangiales bacterium]